MVVRVVDRAVLGEALPDLPDGAYVLIDPDRGIVMVWDSWDDVPKQYKKGWLEPWRPTGW